MRGRVAETKAWTRSRCVRAATAGQGVEAYGLGVNFAGQGDGSQEVGRAECDDGEPGV